ncbi:MAG: hypothetical protein JSW11_16710 [Candidatus Heimdallarchaeota archaeon]|nr:MAG: hypothetical protein JSW11_16710 [Candidatus Heimdallarchaeota archaeon]
MVGITEKLLEFKLLVGSESEKGFVFSRHKIFIVFCYCLSFILIFIHFATLPESVITDCKNAYSAGQECNLPSSGSLILAVFIYLYISFMAIVTIFRNGTLPSRSTIRFPSLRRRYKILILFLLFFFTGLVFATLYISIFGTFLLVVYLGPVMFYIWMILEPFFLLSGILVFIDIIDADYPFQGYTSRNKRSLWFIFIIGFNLPLYFTWFLINRTTPGDFAEFDILGLIDFSLYKPGVVSFTRTFTSVLTLALIFITLWWIKDRYKVKSASRERKKGFLPWFLAFTLIFITITVVPLMISTRGSLKQIQSIWDILGLFTALIMGLWRVLGLKHREEPLHGWERINPNRIIARIHPYSKALILFVVSIFAFFASIQAATISGITGQPDSLQLLSLSLLAEFIGLSFIIVIWRYKGKERTSDPGFLKSTQKLVKDKVQKFRDSF